MLYFKTIKIENADPEMVENAIVSLSDIKSTTIDFRKPWRSTTEGKYFLGFDNNKEFLITLIQSSGRTIPKVIFRFRKVDQFISYQIRFSYGVLIAFCSIVVTLFAQFMYRYTTGHPSYEPLFINLFALGLILVLCWMDFKKTRALINKAIEETGRLEAISM
ncbi:MULTISPECIES: hypothetical protein [Niastella]|uniref:Uncharacterized protein n=1 Tax=Niastella soli TaxID=2821487 RepID=A0ABS3Z4Z7_9BACT|nr:hypothetical protein [Niastella soli]MBO9205237.1 hypothetical protein [Niastella soli]